MKGKDGEPPWYRGRRKSPPGVSGRAALQLALMTENMQRVSNIRDNGHVDRRNKTWREAHAATNVVRAAYTARELVTGAYRARYALGFLQPTPVRPCPVREKEALRMHVGRGWVASTVAIVARRCACPDKKICRNVRRRQTRRRRLWIYVAVGKKEKNSPR